MAPSPPKRLKNSMQKLVEYIVKAIVAHPERVKIEEKEANEEVKITLSVHPDDLGRVIGKSGKIIRAIRALVHILGIKRKKRPHLELVET